MSAATKPDLIVLHGDRIEALAGALVAATNYVRSAHVEGGEVSGTIDEVFRHCNTKLCTHHFRVLRRRRPPGHGLGRTAGNHPCHRLARAGFPRPPLGRDAGRGARAIRDQLPRLWHRDLPPGHQSEQDTIGAQAAALFGALEASGRISWSSPRTTTRFAGHLRVLENLPKDRFRVLPSMRFAHFSELMKNAACMVGNSSAGVREAPFLGLPSLDIGTRQSNRSDAPSVTACDAGDRRRSLAFLSDHWGRESKPHARIRPGVCRRALRSGAGAARLLEP
jgi:UDP-N-acetylglucosamine 2-epimerase (hydrolysing)